MNQANVKVSFYLKKSGADAGVTAGDVKGLLRTVLLRFIRLPAMSLCIRNRKRSISRQWNCN